MSFSGQSPKANRLRLQPQSADPVNPADGDLFYADGTSRREGLWYYKNGAWTQDNVQDEGLFTLNILATGSNPTLAPISGTKNYFSVTNNVMDIWISFAQGGAGSAGSGTYLIQLPTGWNVDLTKIALSSLVSRNAPVLGVALLPGTATNTDEYFVKYTDNGSVSGLELRYAKNTDFSWGSSSVGNLGASPQFSVVARIPVIKP